MLLHSQGSSVCPENHAVEAVNSSKEEALKKILEQMYKLYPDATEKEIRKEI